MPRFNRDRLTKFESIFFQIAKLIFLPIFDIILMWQIVSKKNIWIKLPRSAVLKLPDGGSYPQVYICYDELLWKRKFFGVCLYISINASP